jgi:hypothetical protein
MKVHAHLRYTLTIDGVVSVAEGAVKIDAFTGSAKDQADKVRTAIAELGEQVLRTPPSLMPSGKVRP